MTISNPFDIGGNVDIDFGYGPAQAVSKAFDIAIGAPIDRLVSLDSADMQQLMGKKVGLFVGGPVSSSSPITVLPKDILSIVNRLSLVLHVGGK